MIIIEIKNFWINIVEERIEVFKSNIRFRLKIHFLQQLYTQKLVAQKNYLF